MQPLINFSLGCTFISLCQAALAGAPPNTVPSDQDLRNTAGGTLSLSNNSSGTDNTGLGYLTLYLNSMGSGNSALGTRALMDNTSGGANTALGSHALRRNTTGSSNTAAGFYALNNNTTGQANTALGVYALLNNSVGENNTALGTNSLLSNTTGNNNTGGGASALWSNTTGGNNTAYGAATLYRNTTGIWNTASGSNTLVSNTVGSYNTGYGTRALASNESGGNNTAVGVQALHANTSGGNNTAQGFEALFSNLEGQGNTAVGFHALNQNLYGNNSTAIGQEALAQQGGTAGFNNVGIGYRAGYNLQGGNDNIYLGHTGAATESKTLRLGQAQTRTFLAGTYGRKSGTNALPVYIGSNGQLGTVQSSQRYKKDIEDMGNVSHAIYTLRPVTYHYREPAEDGTFPLEYGLIAEEVAKTMPELVAYGSDGQVETVQYHKLIPLLLNEVQRQAQEIQQLQAQLGVMPASAVKTSELGSD